MHSNTSKNKVSTKSNIPLPQSGGRTLMYSSSANVSSKHSDGQASRYGVTGVEMQSSKEDFKEHEYVSGGRTIAYSATETTKSHIGGKIDSYGVIDGHDQNTSSFTKHGDMSSRQTMNYSSSGTITSSQAAGKVYRQGGIESGMRTSKDSGFGEHDNVSQQSGEVDSFIEEFRIELNENDEDVLKEELLHIFERERTSLELYFKKKMEETLRGFRSRQLEWDEATRAERAELEKNVSMEKMEMQKKFAEEIDKLTQSFREERQQLELYYQEQLQELREKLGIEQTQMGEKFAKEKIELKEKLEAEYEVMLRKKLSHEKQEKMREKSEMEERLSNEKLVIERKFNLRLTEVENNLQRAKAEFETNLSHERMRMEKEFQEKIRHFEERLQEERLLRLDMEKELEQQREKSVNGESMNKKENERLRNDVEVLRLEIEEKNRINKELNSFQETVTLKGREGLSGRLKDDFEKLLAEHKMELDKTCHTEKEALDQKVQSERQQMREELDREKEKMKSEKEEIVRTRERLQVEEKAQIDRQQKQRSDSEWTRSSMGNQQNERVHQQKQRGDSEWTISSMGNQQNERVGETVDRGVHKQQRGDNERMGSPLGDRQVDLGIGALGLTTNRQEFSDSVSNVAGLSYWQSHQQPPQQQSQKGTVWTEASAADSHVVQHAFTGSHRQSKDSEYNLKNDQQQQSHYHDSFVYHEKQELPSTKPARASDTRTTSVEQPGARSIALYHIPADNDSALRFEIDALKSENNGLKAKVVALEENIDLHKKYKEEAKAEMERLLKANQDNDLKIQTLTSHVVELGKTKPEKVDDRKRHHEDQNNFHTHEDRARTVEKTDRHLEEKLRGLESRAVKAEKTTKDYDVKTRLTEERRREHRRQDSNGSQHDTRGQWSASSSIQKDKSRHEFMPRDDRQDFSYKAKYEATRREKNKLLQVTKELQMKIKTLEEKQAEILHHTSHLEKSSEKSGETERLKRLVSENSSLKERTSELQNQLERLLEKLKNEKEKAACFETEISTRKSESLHDIQGLQERLMHTGRELSDSRGELDPDALKRIEREIVTIGQVIKTQFGEGSRGDLSHRSMAEDTARIAQLEVEKKELETKLTLAREAMNEYVTRLNEKMQDVESMTGMSGEMVQELHFRNSNLKKSLQDLEEGQKTSHLQNEQLRHQKSVLQNLIGDLCSHEEPTGTPYNSSPRYFDSEHRSRSYDNKEFGGTSHSASSKYLDSTYNSRYASAHDKGSLGGTSYNTSSKYMGYKYDDKNNGIYDNRYEDFDTSLEDRYLSKDFKEIHDGEKLSRRSKGEKYSCVFKDCPSNYSRFEDQKDFEGISALY